MLIFGTKLRQVGMIVFGAGINERQWIENARAEGFTVLICGGYAELYK